VDERLGSTIRLLRRRKGWRQADLARAAGSSKTAVGRMERGLVGSSSVDHIRQVAAALDVRVDLVPRWRGGELERLLNRRHSAMHEAVARWIRALPGWLIVPEASFSIFGERGIIDILAWHAAAEALAIVELKTAIVDVQELIGTMDRRRRLARRIAAERGWQPRSVSAVVLVEDGRTNRRRLIEHRTVLRAAFPSDGRRLAGWLRNPRRAVAVLAIWPKVHPGDLGPRSGGSQRMRVGAPRSRRAAVGPRSLSNEVTDGRNST
jgi:transcriptional regulator with XRE-family HTH domain